MEECMRNGISEYSNARCLCQISTFLNESTADFTSEEKASDSSFDFEFEGSAEKGLQDLSEISDQVFLRIAIKKLNVF
ncbi:hypothetical protein SDJN02_05882, partial [Cucurbita argyrosperma subsp. argyrosperma]